MELLFININYYNIQFIYYFLLKNNIHNLLLGFPQANIVSPKIITL